MRAVPERHVDMNMLPAEAIDKKQARAALPPLIKGYLRLGGFVGDGAVVDRQFNTTDVAIIVKTGWVKARSYRHYTREDGAERRDRKSVVSEKSVSGCVDLRAQRVVSKNKK